MKDSRGDDLYDGGKGTDTVDFSDIDLSIIVDLRVTGAQAAGPGSNTFTDVENPITGSLKDILTGNDLANKFISFGGNDTLYGGTGDDEVNGGLCNDLMDGGACGNLASYFATAGAVHVDLAISGPPNTLGAGIDTIKNCLDLEGGKGNDTLMGDGDANNITGGGGADVITGRLGADILSGGAGQDRFVCETALDSILGAHDRITDFTPGLDHIDLRHIEANPNTPGIDHFTFIGTSAFGSTPGQLRVGAGYFEAFTGASGLNELYVALDHGYVLTTDDFLL